MFSVHEINDSDKENRIFPDFSFIENEETDSFSFPPAQQGQTKLGVVHSFRRLCQEKGLKAVSQAIELAAECQPFISAIDRSFRRAYVRPRLQVGTQPALNDTGAAVSMQPKSSFKNASKDTLVLEAVNKSRFETFGYRMKTVKIGKKSYQQKVILAQVEMPILGWDFIETFRLSFDWN